MPHLQLPLHNEVIRILDEEAIAFGLHRQDFARSLLNHNIGTVRLQRPYLAPQHEMLPVPQSEQRPRRGAAIPPRGPAKTPLHGYFTKIFLRLYDDQFDWLYALSCRLGGMPYASLFSYFVLHWCNINPLTQPRPEPPPRPSASSDKSSPTTPPTFAYRAVPLTVATQAIEIFDEEASFFGLQRAPFVRSVLYHYMGRYLFPRPPNAPKRSFLAVPKRRPKRTSRTRGDLQKISMTIHDEQINWMYALQWKLGGMPYASILQYYLFDWCDINPLTKRDEKGLTESQPPTPPAPTDTPRSKRPAVRRSR